MSEHVDGIVAVDTELDTKGFKAGSQELKRAIKSLNTKMNALGPIFQKALSGNTKAMSDLNAKSSALRDTIAGIEEKMQELAETELPTDQYKLLADEIQKAKKQLIKYDDKQEEMEALGTKDTSREWRKNQYYIDLTTQKIKEYELEMEGMRDAKTAFKPGAATEEYAKLSADLARAKSALQSMSLEEQKVTQSATPMAGLFERAKSYFSDLKSEMQQALPLTTQIKNGVSSFANSYWQLINNINSKIYEAGLSFGNVIRSCEAQIANINSKIYAAGASFGQAMRNIGPALKNAFTNPIGTARSLFSSLNQKAGAVAVAVRQIGSSLLSGTVSGLRQAISGGTSLARTLAGSASSGVKRLGSSIKTGLSAGLKKSASFAKKFFSLFKKGSGSGEGAISKLGKKITSIGTMLKRMVLRKIVSGIFNGAKEGFNNLAQYSSGVNSNLSTLKSGLTQLKNSFATAFAPILNVVTPILSKLIGYLSQAATYVGKLFAALTGAKTFTKATAVQEDYAASLENSAKAAESSSQRQSASFDDLNVLNDSSSSSDNSNDGNASVSEMFEEVPIESSIIDFMGRIKDAFKNGNFAEIGEILGNGINTAVQKVHDFISWDNVGGIVTKVIKGVAEGFNSLIYTINWELIGDTVAKGLNTVLNTLYLIVTEFDWPAVAAALARSLNGLVSGFDWSKLGTLISTGFITAVKSLRSAISTFDWMSLGKGIADSINAIDWVGAFSQLAGLLSDAIIGLLDLCIGFMEGIDWGKLGSDLWNSLVGIVKNIDWGALVAKAFRLLGNVIGACYSVMFGIAKSVWESLKSAFKSSVIYFWGYIVDAGGNIIQGLWNGICDALKNVGKWIWDNIFVPFWDGIRNAFGIHSPSTKMAEIGGYLIEGLLNGITNVWNSITGFFGGALSSLGSTISTGWESIKSGASTAWSNISTSLSNTWSSIKTNVSTAATNVKDSASNAWNNIKTNTSSAWSNVKTSISDNLTNAKTNASSAWNSIKSTTSTVGSNVSSSVATAWTNVKGFITNNLNTAKSGASTVWSSIKSTVTSSSSSISGNVSSAWTSIKGYVTNNLTTAKTNASAAWSSIKSTASTVGTSISSNVSSAWASIKGHVTNNLNTAKTSASTAWNSIKSTASTVGTSIKTTASSAWTSIKGYVTTNLTNAKTSASTAWSSIKSTASSNNSSIKSTMSTTWSSIKSTMTTRMTEMKSSASSTFSSLKTSATTWGKDVCLNMANGIKNAMSKVSDACTDVAKKIKSLLGFSEPEDGPLSNFHTYMPDMIDLMVYGIKKNEGQAIGAVSDMASAISEEIQNGDYALSDIQISEGKIDGTFDSFSDKIVDGFDTLIKRLQTIAESVTFAIPQVAEGGIIPYSVSANGANDASGRLEETINASNDELASVIIQSVTNATAAIVNAVRDYSGPTVNIDRNSLTTGIIEDIKRRTRMMGGKSVLDT